ncbi:hypothetical protein K402DRAFT_11414 [Aulographum hederae CBS 113979]|uniref:Uncharacterized protein n=1 Tax=Aulographum hederae CBS 113979 TaxID=1176131 RepID=A0A6G1H7J7_9PEZI|nr:hypothetical protein K402DRAFT_11414 [Aulographum hederae CBS 113979]
MTSQSKPTGVLDGYPISTSSHGDLGNSWPLRVRVLLGKTGGSFWRSGVRRYGMPELPSYPQSYRSRRRSSDVKPDRCFLGYAERRRGDGSRDSAVSGKAGVSFHPLFVRFLGITGTNSGVWEHRSIFLICHAINYSGRTHHGSLITCNR